MAKNGIKLSPQHGVNPCIPVCCWCGREKSEIALMGKLPGDAQAPMHAIIDYEPCGECAAAFAQGVQVIEVVDASPDGRPAISKRDDGQPIYPTFRTVAVKPDAARETLGDDSLNPGDKVCVDKPGFEHLFKNILHPELSEDDSDEE